MIKAVIFDYDETLTKTIEGKAKAYSDFARAEYNQSLTVDEVKKAFGIPYEKFIEKLFGQVEEVNVIIEKYQKFSQNYPPIPYENAEEVINKLFERYLVGIVSGIRRKAIFNDLCQLKFDQKCFFHIQCGDDTKDLKPDPKVFDSLMLKLKLVGILPNEVVYVGDNIDDFLAAKAAGFNFIGMAGHTRPENEFAKVQTETINRFDELMTKLTNI
jgi:HAD superfamily hydrolase (TIGR01549 family)